METTQNQVVQKPRKQYTGIAARLLNILGSGTCSQVQAAQAVGVDPSFVSQLCAEEDFQVQIAEKLKKGMEVAIETDNNYAAIEKELSDRLRALAPWIQSPDQVIRTLKFVNEAKKKVQVNPAVNPGEGTERNKAVRLLIPVVVKQTFITNPNNEIVQVDGRDLVTLNSNSMQELLKEKLTIEDVTPKKVFPNELAKQASTDYWSNL